MTKELTEREKFHRNEKNPGMFRGFESNNTYQDPSLLHLSASRAPRLNSEPTPAIKRPFYERRQFDKERKEALKKAAKPNLAEVLF